MVTALSALGDSQHGDTYDAHKRAERPLPKFINCTRLENLYKFYNKKNKTINQDVLV